MKINENICREFIYQVLSSRHFENTMIARGQGAAQMNIGKSDIECYKIPYTVNKNTISQTAKLLKLYDDKIIIAQNIVDFLQKQKQYFLRQMFI
jgi:type I restriction enzyme S subunit